MLLIKCFHTFLDSKIYLTVSFNNNFVNIIHRININSNNKIVVFLSFKFESFFIN